MTSLLKMLADSDPAFGSSQKDKEKPPPKDRMGLSKCDRNAERTGLEPATSYVTGRRSNQLNYHSNSMNGMGKQCLSLCGAFNADTLALSFYECAKSNQETETGSIRSNPLRFNRYKV
jgi:hypothetical protein